MFTQNKYQIYGMKEQTGDSVSSPQSPVTDGAVTKQNLLRLGVGGVYGAMVARSVVSNVRQTLETTSGNELLLMNINNAQNALTRSIAIAMMPKIAIPATVIEFTSQVIMRGVTTRQENREYEYERRLQGHRIMGVSGSG